MNLEYGESLARCFRESSDELVRRRLNSLGDEDCEQQIKVIRSSLFSRGERHGVEAGETTEAKTAREEAESLGPGDLVAEAVAIAKDLRERAIQGDDGSAAWLGLEFVPGAERWQLKPLGRDLYSGTCGIALFLATVDKATSDECFRPLALGALQSLQKILRDEAAGQRLAEAVGIGGAAGLGSYIYALVRIGEMLGEEHLLKDAKRVAKLVTAEVLDHDEGLDIIMGSAGAILSLLALHEYTGDGEALEIATACGQHLLESRTESKHGPRAWKTLPNNEHLLTGFSHGAAGIAYALLRLYQATCCEEFKEAAAEAIDFESSVFSPDDRNWPDFRSNNNQSYGFSFSWCHGVPGIGLARIGGLKVLDNRQVRQDIEVAIEATLARGMAPRDHLCCGTMGRSELLLAAARILNRPELEEAARNQAGHLVQRARQRGYVFLDSTPGEAYVPGLFQGAAGIGYELLRLAYPDAIPSMLLWE